MIHDCIDCILRRQSLAAGRLTAGRLTEACVVAYQRDLLAHQGISFLPHKEYMKLGRNPVPTSLLAIEPGLERAR
jgi:hypothetical protein